jgi:AMP-binding enzyme
MTCSSARSRQHPTLAERLRGFGLPADTIVALQLPNTVDSVIALLGVLRAGLIAAPLPLLWRQADATAVLGRIGTRAMIACRRVGDVDYGELAMHIAAETFAIRFLCAFGTPLPDGVVPLDTIFTQGPSEPVAAIERRGNAADHIATVTFEVTSEGIVPVARSHAELIAAGFVVQHAAQIGGDSVILGAVATSSLGGIASTIIPWLLSGGGTLVMHHPFAANTFAAQRAHERCNVAVVPGPLVQRFFDGGLIGPRQDMQSVLALWRAPERMAVSLPWPAGRADLIDVPVFGETGLLALRRGTDGKATELPLGRVTSPQGVHVMTVSRTLAGTLALSGPMVPRFHFPPGVERVDAPRLKIADGMTDTGYQCRLSRDKTTLAVDGPPAGIVNVGGYRFGLRSMQELISSIEDGGTLAALPDMLSGYRLAGAGTDRNAICDILLAHGANPLLVAAFRGRRQMTRASAA